MNWRTSTKKHIIDTGDDAIIFKGALVSESSRITCPDDLKAFVRYTGLDDIDKINPYFNGDTKKWKLKIISYFGTDEMKKLSYGSRKCRMRAIRKWCDLFEIQLPWKAFSKGCLGDKNRQTKYRGYNDNEAETIYFTANSLRDKALVSFYESTGARHASVHDRFDENKYLRYGDLEEATYKGRKFYRVIVYNDDTDSYYPTRTTPECFEDLKRYFDHRRELGEIFTKDTPVFRKDYDKRRYKNLQKEKERLAKMNDDPKNIALQYVAVDDTFRVISEKGHINKHLKTFPSGYKVNEVQLIHGWRKRFDKSLMNAGVNEMFKKLLIGWTIELDEIYYEEDDEESKQKLDEEYFKAVDKLTINPNNRLRGENAELTDQITQRQDKDDVRDKEIKELKATVRLLGKRLGMMPNDSDDKVDVVKTLIGSGALKAEEE